MIQKIEIDRQTGNGKYGDVLDAAEQLAAGDYGSAVNALAVMVRKSPLFHEATLQLQHKATGCSSTK